MCKENPYSKLIVITNRQLVDGDFLKQLERVLKLHPDSCILREKDLFDDEYLSLAAKVLELCQRANVPLYIHGRMKLAKSLNCRNIHFSFKALEEADKNFLKANFDNVSVASHSIDEVKKAVSLGATRIILGTIFETDCKKGLKGAGTGFVKEAAEVTSLPIFAIGGIKPENLTKILAAGAAGGCMMSGFMRSV